MRSIHKYFIPLLLLYTFVFSACTKDDSNVLQVKSIDYTGLAELSAAEPDEQTIRDWPLIGQNTYSDYMCYLTLDGNQIIVSDHHTYPNTYITHGTTNGYFVGVDVGEFDGWVKYFPHYSTIDPENTGPSRNVVNENCRGFVEEGSGNLVYLFTWDYAGLNSHGSGFIYELRFPSLNGEREWEWERVNEIEGIPLFLEYDRENKIIYIVSSLELVAFSLEDYSVTALADLSLWQYSSATSMVRLNDKLYIGMPMGIYEYDLTTTETKWYPMDYSKYVS